jgi:hypothetical protein
MTAPLPDPAAVTPRRATEGQSWLGIAEGYVVAVMIADGTPASLDAYAEYAFEWGITEIVLMPDEGARHFYNRPWPGRDAALAQIAQEADRGS